MVTSLCNQYLIKSEHSLATHGYSMMMVMADYAADVFHSFFEGAKKSNCILISKY